MKNIKLMIILCVVIFLITACFASPSKSGSQTEVGDQNRWQTYTNDKYQFTVQFPSVWQVIELPTPEFPTTTDQVWFVNETLPQPQTGSRADVVLIFTQDDPSPSWESHYFDEYQSDILWLGNIQARRISGVNKESRFSEIVFLAKIGDYYLQALPNNGEASLAYFDQMVSSIRFAPTDSATPLPLVSDNRGNLEDKTIEVDFRR